MQEAGDRRTLNNHGFSTGNDGGKDVRDDQRSCSLHLNTRFLLDAAGANMKGADGCRDGDGAGFD